MIDLEKFFEILKGENPQLLLNIYNCLEDLNRYFNMVQTYDLCIKDYDEISNVYNMLNEMKDSMPIEGIQLSLNLLNNEKVFLKSVNLLYDFSYTKPKSFSIYRGKDTEVKSFKEMYEKILQYFLKMDDEKMYSLINRTKYNGDFRPYFHKNPKKLITPFKISDNLYAETHFTANKIRDMLIKIFNLYNIDINNLRIYLKYDRKEKFGYYK